MKKSILCIILCLCLLPVMAFAGGADSVSAANAKDAGLHAGWNIVINGAPLNMSQAPYIENDRALANGRALCQALGVSCRYENGVLNILDGAMVFTKGSFVCSLNGVAKNLDASANEKNGELFVPVRFLAENLGYKVDFRQEMTADGRSVFASVVLVDTIYSLLLPEDRIEQLNALEVAAMVANVAVKPKTVSKADYEAKAMSALSTGEQALFFGAGPVEFTESAKAKLLDLTAYIQKQAPATWYLIENDEAIRKQVLNEKGAVIAFPIQNGEALEWIAVSNTVDDIEKVVSCLYAYSEITKALAVE